MCGKGYSIFFKKWSTPKKRINRVGEDLLDGKQWRQAAESRISDADMATEMTEFVKSQILTQSATAMLAQANALPEMALQLIQGQR